MNQKSSGLVETQTKNLVSVDGLSVDYWRNGIWNPAVRNVDFSLKAGEALGIVGESGSGKSTLVTRLLGLEHPLSRSSGRISIAGHNILGEPEDVLQKLRGRIISFVPQNPLTSLTPNIRIGKQLAESMLIHGVADRKHAWERTLDLLDQVKLPNPKIIAQRYPYQLSGGQLQRVVIAIALACQPELLVMDEPTTGLDVTTQDQILRLLRELRTTLGTSIVYVSHDLGVVSELCDRVAVMYAGSIVETASTRSIFREPRHPYTKMLIESMPLITPGGNNREIRRQVFVSNQPSSSGCSFKERCNFAQLTCSKEVPILLNVSENHEVACTQLVAINREIKETKKQINVEIQRPISSQNVLEIRDLNCGYISRNRLFGKPAVDVVHGVSLTVARGEIVALVGESGSGKSTIAKTIIGLLQPTHGAIIFQSETLATGYAKRSPDMRRRIQLVPQNPDASLNPQQRVSEIIGRAVEKLGGLTGLDKERKVDSLLTAVQLENAYRRRYPRELSGGERQRVAIARALAAEPELLLCDEILSALDVSTQSEIRKLLLDLQQERNLAFLFISHDLAVVRELADRVVVLHGGSVCEVGKVSEVFSPPYHPYTYQLLTSVPGVRSLNPNPSTFPLTSLIENTGCSYSGKCQFEIDVICRTKTPPLQKMTDNLSIYCHAHLDTLRSFKEPIWNAGIELSDDVKEFYENVD